MSLIALAFELYGAIQTEPFHASYSTLDDQLVRKRPIKQWVGADVAN
jgi:hypothetical protein